MSNKSSSGTTAGIGFVDVLTLTFIVLKLVGVIDWSWWWVLSPLWLGLAVFLSVCVVIFGIGAVASVIVAVIDKRK